MNPVPVMALVEIIKGLATSQETLDVTLQLATAMGKTTAQAQDVPGFIANRYQPSLNPFASRKPMRDCRHCHGTTSSTETEPKRREKETEERVESACVLREREKFTFRFGGCRH